VEEVVVASLVSFASYIRSTRPTKQKKEKKKEAKKEVYPSWCAVQSKRKRGFLFLMCRTTIHK
jgi:hypothetical protein